MTAMVHVVAALSWDPQVRGFLIFLTMFVVLVGSTYLLIATNTGARLGFLLAATGLAGWCALMGWIWVMYGIGIKGHEPHWEVKEVVQGDVRANSVIDDAANFPNGWEKLEEGDPILGDASAAADAVLLGSTSEGAGHGGAAAAPPKFPAVFKEATEFVHVDGYRTGGEDYWIPGGYLERNETPFRGWLHQPHYTVIQVAPTVPVEEGATAPTEPEIDKTKPMTSVVMVRNLGTLRRPSAMFATAFSILFVVLCVVLHRRDKALMASRAAAAPAAA